MRCPSATLKSLLKFNWTMSCQVSMFSSFASFEGSKRIPERDLIFTENSYLSTTVVSGLYVKTVAQWFRPGYYQLFQLFDDGSGTTQNSDLALIQVTYGLGVIDNGREVITRIGTDLLSGGFGMFYTVCVSCSDLFVCPALHILWLGVSTCHVLLYTGCKRSGNASSHLFGEPDGPLGW